MKFKNCLSNGKELKSKYVLKTEFPEFFCYISIILSCSSNYILFDKMLINLGHLIGKVLNFPKKKKLIEILKIHLKKC